MKVAQPPSDPAIRTAPIVDAIFAIGILLIKRVSDIVPSYSDRHCLSLEASASWLGSSRECLKRTEVLQPNARRRMSFDQPSPLKFKQEFAQVSDGHLE